MSGDGGYDDGYRECECFWGTEPGSLIRKLPNFVPGNTGLRVLDAGCGEGKNAIFLARQGATVDACDISAEAIANAKLAWPDVEIVNWQHSDVRRLDLPEDYYDVVIMYGFLHCLSSISEVRDLVARLKSATAADGLHVVCTFNSRAQDLSAHVGFQPVLIPHCQYLAFYGDWSLKYVSDTDLHETHPHNKIPHKHSMTRLIVQKGGSR